MRNIKCCLVICLTLPLFILFLSSHIYASQSPPTIYTIQTASLTDVAHAHEQFDSITQQLNEKELDYLRIEKVGKFYAIRLGKFENRATAKKFLKTIKPQLSTAIIMKAYVIEERIVKLYKGLPSVEDTRVKEKPLPSPVPEEIKPTVAVEDTRVEEKPLPSPVPEEIKPTVAVEDIRVEEKPLPSPVPEEIKPTVAVEDIRVEEKPLPSPMPEEIKPTVAEKASLGVGNIAIKLDYIDFTDDVLDDADDDTGLYVGIEGFAAIISKLYFGVEVGYINLEGKINTVDTEVTFVPMELNLKYSVEPCPNVLIDFGVGASANYVELTTTVGGDTTTDNKWLYGGQVFIDLNYLLDRFFIGINGKYQLTEEYDDDLGPDYNNWRIGGQAGLEF